MAMGPRNELLKRAMERQSHGAQEALLAIIASESLTGDSDAGWANPSFVQWKEEWSDPVGSVRCL
jgi:hypothetical protein